MIYRLIKTDFESFNSVAFNAMQLSCEQVRGHIAKMSMFDSFTVSYHLSNATF